MNAPGAPDPTSAKPRKAKHSAPSARCIGYWDYHLGDSSAWRRPARCMAFSGYFCSDHWRNCRQAVADGSDGAARSRYDGVFRNTDHQAGIERLRQQHNLADRHRVFHLSRLIKTGLGSRLAYLFMAALGRKTLGLSYGLIATDLVLVLR